MKRQESIFVFGIPKDVVDSLEPVEKELAVVEQAATLDTNVTASALERLQIQQERLDQDITSLTCNTCAAVFDDREEQRLHFNTDWHRYNIKRKVVLNINQPVTLEQFEALLADLDESISGSEDEDSNDEDEESIDSLVEKQKREQEEKEALENDAKQVVLPIMKKFSALNWFKQKDTSDSVHYGLYRHLLDSNSIASLQQKKKRTWTILMLGGGHFAGCVIDVNNSLGPNASVDKQVKIITHKTFHRYTTRRKQGGSQSTNDNAKGAANSAGAQIRRYNEQVLQQEVREVLNQWKSHIGSSEMVLVHAPSNNRKILFNYEGAPLDRCQIKSIPFVTRRPTLNELKRVFVEMTTVKVMAVDEQAIETYKQKWIDQQKKQKKLLEKSSAIKKTKAVEKKQVNPALDKLMNLVRQNKTAVTLAYLEKNMNLPVSGLLPAEELADEDLYHYPTLLHLVASIGGASDLVTALLAAYDADPTIISDAGKTAYEVSKDKETRNAFRRCMNDYPTKWHWLDDARVPSPLTAKQEQELMAKEAKKQAKEAEKRRLLEQERQRVEAQQEAKEVQIQLDKLQATRAKNFMLPKSTVVEDLSSMTPEARMRFEREKRARAAEARFAKK